MPLIRGNHYFDDHFTQIPNSWIRDHSLSLKARGLLGLILSNSTEFKLSIRGLASVAKEGRDAIRSAVKELESAGYLTRTEELDHTGEPFWQTCDPRRLENPTMSGGKSDGGRLENPTIKNNNKKNKLEKNINAQSLFDDFWNEYPRKLDKAKAFKAFKSALTRAKFEDIMAGLVRYKNDPTRKPDFTKYPATWLNADSWENDYESAPDVESKKRMEREREWTRNYLAEQQSLAEQAGEIPKCQHGANPALCRDCLKGIS